MKGEKVYIKFLRDAKTIVKNDFFSNM